MLPAILGGVAAAAGLYGAKKNADAADEANRLSAEAREASQAYIEEASRQARGDILELFPAAQQSRQTGIGAQMDFLRQAVPVQTNLFQQGNVAAQEQLARGLPQIQNAILGNAIDYSAFQPTQLDSSGIGALMAQAQVPEFQIMNPSEGPSLFNDPNDGTIQGGVGGQPSGRINWAQYVQNHPDLWADFQRDNRGQSIEEWGEQHYNRHGINEQRDIPYYNATGSGTTVYQARGGGVPQPSGIGQPMPSQPFVYRGIGR
jgi:hypothetical protein